MAIHRFQPDHYHVTIGSHEPVLRIADADTVITTTVDSGGRDAADQQVTMGGNPQTGPFSIEGAEVGDTLAVHFDRLWPNRTLGRCASRLAPNVVDPQYVCALPSDNPMSEWEVDRERGTATLSRPETKLGRLTLPIAPMLGCFGVAPALGEAISCATSGRHGGNMDYRGFAQGITVVVPVLVPGALLHVGDGHALQGDGEIVGTGIEISFEVQFTVHLLKGKQIGWPRAENADSIITVGNARPLDQALQHATTEMTRWLQDEYGLDAHGAQLLMGLAVEYQVGNVFDPAYTMVCKMSKEVLRRISG
jgi:acetamidase/formamidase